MEMDCGFGMQRFENRRQYEYSSAADDENCWRKWQPAATGRRDGVSPSGPLSPISRPGSRVWISNAVNIVQRLLRKTAFSAMSAMVHVSQEFFYIPGRFRLSKISRYVMILISHFPCQITTNRNRSCYEKNACHFHFIRAIAFSAVRLRQQRASDRRRCRRTGGAAKYNE